MKNGVLFLSLVLLAAPLTASAIFISEVQTGLPGAGNSGKDFIELHNDSDTDFNLNGYRLVKRTKTGAADVLIKAWTEDALLPANSYYLWASSEYTELASLANAIGSQTIADDNAVALRLAETDEIVDAIAWGGNQSGLAQFVFQGNIPAGKSLAKIADSFALLDNPSPKAANFLPVEPEPEAPDETEPPPSPQIFITEILPNPGGADAGQEWIELYNASDFEGDLSNWILMDGNSGLPGSKALILPTGTKIQPGQYLSLTVPSGKFTVNNSNETIRLFNPAKELKDLVSFNGAPENESWAKTRDGLWQWSIMPTPGRVNIFPEPAIEIDSDEIEEADKYAAAQVTFNEALSNPDGADSGGEWLELLNLSSEPVDLSGWILDDDGKTVGKDAYYIEEGVILTPAGLLGVEIPAKHFTITNTGERVRLLSPDKKERAWLEIPDLPENESYARREDGQWQNSQMPTFGQANVFTAPSKNLQFSEIFIPGKDQDGYIKIKNFEETWTDLSFWRIVLGASQYIFPRGASVPAVSELMISEDELGIRPNSKSWIKFQLLRPDGVAQDVLEAKKLPTRSVKLGQTLRINKGIVESQEEKVVEPEKEEEMPQAPPPEVLLMPLQEKIVPAKPSFFHRLRQFLCYRVRFLLKCNL